jgi:hypothetical protein
MKPRFYIRFICFAPISWWNTCIVFDGWKLPYKTDASIRADLTFLEINI